MDFLEIAKLSQTLEEETGRNEMIELVSDFLSRLPADELLPACYMLTNPPKTGVGWACVRDVLLRVTGAREEELFKAFSETGDLGEAAYRLFETRKIRVTTLESRPLTISEVWETMKRTAETPQATKKERLIEALYLRCSPLEAKLLTKILTGELRTGFKEGLLLPALSKTYSIPLETIRRAWAVGGPELTLGSLNREEQPMTNPFPFQPVLPMLAHTASSFEEIFDEHGGSTFLEFKLDGARVQIHSSTGKVSIFSRTGENIAQSMPEIVQEVRELGIGECILEGEVVALRDERPLPFQYLLKRFRRKHEVQRAVDETPLKLYLFDALFLNGSSLLDLPYEQRREKLEEIGGELLVPKKEVRNPEEAEEFFKLAIEKGHEGVIAKKPGSVYKPGQRVRDWLKLKRVLTLDLVIVGAEWGHGRRARWLSDYYLAALDRETGKFEIVGKTFKGLTDAELEQMTKRLKELQISSRGRTVFVKPEIVVEVSFNQVQESPKYAKGMALRFARIERIREDKKPEEASTLDEVRRIFSLTFKTGEN